MSPCAPTNAIPSSGSTRTPLEQLVEAREREHCREREDIDEALAGAHLPREHLAKRHGEQQAEGQVHQAVVVIALPANELRERPPGQRLEPRVIRDDGVRVMSSHLVEREEPEDRA